MTTATVVFEKAACIYPGNDKLLADQLDLKTEDGESLTLVGPSGYGKSTSLCMLVGPEDINEGYIFIGDKDVTDVPLKNCDTAMVFQNYALYPHMTVRESMGFALKIAGTPKKEIAKRAEEAARILDFESYLDRKPKALSGGQRQRVAMGRAIVRKPQVFFMDEPPPSLDVKLCVQTRTQIASLQCRLDVATVHVTHDQMEILTMGDRIAALEDGLLQQAGSPQEMYERPANEFVAGFVGSPAMNLGKSEVEGSTAVLGPVRISLSVATVNALTAEDKDMITVRFCPEGLELVSEAEVNPIPIQADFVGELDPDAFVYGHLAGTDGQSIGSAEGGSLGQPIARVPPCTAPAHGGIVYTRIIAGQQHNSSASIGMRLPG